MGNLDGSGRTRVAPDHVESEHGAPLPARHQHAGVGVIDDERGEVELIPRGHSLRRGHVVETAPEETSFRSWSRDRIVEVSVGVKENTEVSVSRTRCSI